MLAITRMADACAHRAVHGDLEEKKATDLAQRFDRALNTMSHGLVMLGPDGRVVVANAEAARRSARNRPTRCSAARCRRC